MSTEVVANLQVAPADSIPRRVMKSGEGPARRAARPPTD